MNEINYTIFKLGSKWVIAYSSDNQPEAKLITLDLFVERLNNIQNQLRSSATTVSMDALDDANVIELATRLLVMKMNEDNS